MGTQPGFVRARTPENKERRTADLLDSARELARAQGVRTLTLTAIATRAGVHVSGVRRYFESREEILLVLAGGEWTDWASAVVERLDAAGRPMPGAALARLLASSLEECPLFCDLLAHAQVSLEREVGAASVRAYKVAALDAMAELTAALTRAVPGLTGEAAWNLLASATALAATLWQTANPGEVLAKLYAEDPSLAHARAEFGPRMTEILDALITGLIEQAARRLRGPRARLEVCLPDEGRYRGRL
ncbi:MAG TPA: TetR/AcrR family transcriptional regulator [Trebonia sp.]